MDVDRLVVCVVIVLVSKLLQVLPVSITFTTTLSS